MPLPLVSSTIAAPRSRIRHIVGVASGKGGVGKSSVAVQLALSWAKSGYRVGILDADVYGPSVRRMLPEEKPLKRQGEALIPATSHGISVISMAHFRADNEAVAVRAPIANRLLVQFLDQVAWGELDFLIVDFPPGTGDIQMTLGQRAKLSGVVLVTTPQEVAIQDVRRAWALFEQLRIPTLGVVENMSYFCPEGTEDRFAPFGVGGAQRFASEAGIPFLGEIPIDPVLSKNNDFGDHWTSRSRVMDTFEELGKSLSEQIRLRNVSPKGPRLERWDFSSPDKITFYWEGGQVSHHEATELQKRCPCAGCNGQAKGHSVHFQQVIPVGHYALQFLFSSGCSRGIFPIETLYSWGTK